MSQLAAVSAILACTAWFTSPARGQIMTAPVWFHELMSARECTFTHMKYSAGQCDMLLFFHGRYPGWLQRVGLGLDVTVNVNTTAFAEGVCKCGVMQVAGNCSNALIQVLRKIRSYCGGDNFRGIPDEDQTKEQWEKRIPAITYKAIKIPKGMADFDKEEEIIKEMIDMHSDIEENKEFEKLIKEEEDKEIKQEEKEIEEKRKQMVIAEKEFREKEDKMIQEELEKLEEERKRFESKHTTDKPTQE